MNLNMQQHQTLQDSADIFRLMQISALEDARLSNQRSVYFEKIEKFMDIENLLRSFKPETICNKPSIPIEESIEEISNIGRFERKLTGGSLVIDGNSIFIPESITTAIHAENGDLIKAERAGMLSDGFTIRYIFTIVEKNALPCTRVEALGIIEQNNVGYTAIVDGDEVLLSKHDVEKFSVNVGSVVSVAYYTDNKNTPGKIIKVYPNDGLLSNQIKVSKRKTSQTKLPHITTSQLKGYTVGIVGGYGEEANYRDVLTDLGAEFEYIDPKADKDEIINVLRRVNGLVHVWTSISHHTSNLVKELVKIHKIPMVYAPNTGISGIKRIAIDELLPMMIEKLNNIA